MRAAPGWIDGFHFTSLHFTTGPSKACCMAMDMPWPSIFLQLNKKAAQALMAHLKPAKLFHHRLWLRNKRRMRQIWLTDDAKRSGGSVLPTAGAHELDAQKCTPSHTAPHKSAFTVVALQPNLTPSSTNDCIHTLALITLPPKRKGKARLFLKKKIPNNTSNSLLNYNYKTFLVGYWDRRSSRVYLHCLTVSTAGRQEMHTGQPSLLF